MHSLVQLSFLGLNGLFLPKFKITGIQFTGIHRSSPKFTGIHWNSLEFRILVSEKKFTVLRLLILFGGGRYWNIRKISENKNDAFKSMHKIKYSALGILNDSEYFRFFAWHFFGAENLRTWLFSENDLSFFWEIFGIGSLSARKFKNICILT